MTCPMVIKSNKMSCYNCNGNCTYVFDKLNITLRVNQNG